MIIWELSGFFFSTGSGVWWNLGFRGMALISVSWRCFFGAITDFYGRKKKTSSLGITPFLKKQTQKAWCGCLIYVFVLVCWFEFCFNSLTCVWPFLCIIIIKFPLFVVTNNLIQKCAGWALYNWMEKMLHLLYSCWSLYSRIYVWLLDGWATLATIRYIWIHRFGDRLLKFYEVRGPWSLLLVDISPLGLQASLAIAPLLRGRPEIAEYKSEYKYMRRGSYTMPRHWYSSHARTNTQRQYWMWHSQTSLRPKHRIEISSDGEPKPSFHNLR